MSVFDLPRVHFGGVAVTRLPTGPRAGLLDLETNRAVTDDGVFDTDRPVQEYYDFLEAKGAKGTNFAGNGHFWIDVAVVGYELAPGEVGTDDLLVGRALDLWGHYCEYTAGTANRSRVFDVDPASNRTTTVMVGQLALGRLGRSHDVGYLVTGDVSGMCPPRWQNPRYVRDEATDPRFRRSVVHQFVVDAGDGLYWLDGAQDSPVLVRLRTLVESGAADGLVVQFALTNMATPTAFGEPDFWDLRGTIAPWHATELRTYPAGRLLTPRRLPGSPLHNLSVHVGDEHVTANLVTAIPVTSRADTRGPGPSHRVGPLADLGDLQVRTTSGTVLATVRRAQYLGEEYRLGSGVLVVPRADGAGDPRDALVITTPDGAVLAREEETVVESDEAALFLEHENRRTGEDHAVEIPIRSYVRGAPARVDTILVRQYVNPRGRPLATDHEDVQIMAFLPAGQQDFLPECVASTDGHGRGTVTVKGVRGGAASILLLPDGQELPRGADAAQRYDNDDEQGYWPAVGSVAVRVLPDHWHLDDLPDSAIDFETLYREALAYYELQYSFMRSEVLSLADEFKVEPYARLIWHVSDPKHKPKTFYMPPTRDMSAPQIRMMLRYLLADEARRQTPPAMVPQHRKLGVIATKDQLLHALYQAATIELATMVQYLYAAYSVPIHSAGRQYVARGEWTEEQLLVACGEGTQSWNNGIRGSLMYVAREEMMHFLAINNILMAMGRPFHLPRLDFGTINSTIGVPLEFSLEALNLASVQRFVALEQPHYLAQEVEGNDSATLRPEGEPYPYGSLSELYAAIREGIQAVPGAFLVKKGRGGGAHHLFMRESVNAVHPDYQLEVDDVASAVFAIDFVTEHGEGGHIPSTLPAEESHFDTFLRISELLIHERTRGPNDRRIPWNPAYPVMRNPTLRPGNQALDLVTHEPARLAMTAFNRSYFMAMQLMVQHFGYSPDKNLRRSRVMNWALDIMTGVLRPLGELIVTLPSGRPGRTAGPSFELDSEPTYIARPDVAVEWMAREFDEIAELARKCTGLTPTVADLLAYIGEQLRTMDLEDL